MREVLTGYGLSLCPTIGPYGRLSIMGGIEGGDRAGGCMGMHKDITQPDDALLNCSYFGGMRVIMFETSKEWIMDREKLRINTQRYGN